VKSFDLFVAYIDERQEQILISRLVLTDPVRERYMRS
jgi:hypothetical protein